jgi:hypothetical protein
MKIDGGAEHSYLDQDGGNDEGDEKRIKHCATLRELL